MSLLKRDSYVPASQETSFVSDTGKTMAAVGAGSLPVIFLAGLLPFGPFIWAALFIILGVVLYVAGQ